MSVLGIELKSLDLIAGTLTSGPPCLPSTLLYIIIIMTRGWKNKDSKASSCADGNVPVKERNLSVLER